MCDQATVAVVQQAYLDQAIRNVREAASDGNTPGFMLVHCDSMGMGFSFLVCERDLCASLHALPQHGNANWRYACAWSAGYDSTDSFVEAYLQTVALNVQTYYPQLTAHFARRRSNWRFESWAYGAPAQSRDNDPVWREHLWPLVRRIVTDPPQCVLDMPDIMRGALLKRLSGHVTEGMIVLER